VSTHAWTSLGNREHVRNEPLILDLVAWVAERPRSHAEVMEAWRTSCPRLTIWEDAVDAGLVRLHSGEGPTTLVRVTERGRRLLEANGRGAGPTGDRS
jgi:hypothetical protein